MAAQQPANDAKTQQQKKGVQDDFLRELCDKQLPAHVFLASGIKLQGKIRAFDAFVVFLKNNDTEQMVYKHAISTVVPA